MLGSVILLLDIEFQWETKRDFHRLTFDPDVKRGKKSIPVCVSNRSHRMRNRRVESIWEPMRIQMLTNPWRSNCSCSCGCCSRRWHKTVMMTCVVVGMRHRSTFTLGTTIVVVMMRRRVMMMSVVAVTGGWVVWSTCSSRWMMMMMIRWCWRSRCWWPSWLPLISQLLFSPPFGSSIRKPNLNPCLWQVNLRGQSFSGEDIRVMSSFEFFFQSFDLFRSKGCSVSLKFPLEPKSSSSIFISCIISETRVIWSRVRIKSSNRTSSTSNSWSSSCQSWLCFNREKEKRVYHYDVGMKKDLKDYCVLLSLFLSGWRYLKCLSNALRGIFFTSHSKV